MGISLDTRSVHAVALHQGRIRGWIQVPFPAGMTVQSPTFPDFLKRALAPLVSRFRSDPIWVTGVSPSLQLRFFPVAKVRPAQQTELIYWTFRKEMPFDPEQTIFDYGIEGKTIGNGSPQRVDVTAYTVTRDETTSLVSIFEQAELPLAGIVIPSFALRNFFQANWLSGTGTNLALYVGDDASAISILHDGQVVLSRLFKTGMNAMLDSLRQSHPDWTPAQTYAQVGQVFAADARATQSGDRSTLAIGTTVKAALGRLIQQVERSISAHLSSRGHAEVATLHVAGSITAFPELVGEIGAKLGVRSVAIDLLTPERLDQRTEPPATPAEAGMLAMALGAALSDPAHTPNLLHTQSQRDREGKRKQGLSIAAVCGMMAIALIAVIYGGLRLTQEKVTRELDIVRSRVASYSPRSTPDTLRALMAEISAISGHAKHLAHVYFPVAVMNHIAGNTPADIRLTSFNLTTASATPRLALEGLVQGLPGLQRSLLAGYILDLEDLPTVKTVAVKQSDDAIDETGNILLFRLDLDLLLPSASTPTGGPM